MKDANSLDHALQDNKGGQIQQHSDLKRQFRCVGLTMFLISCGLLILRTVFSFVSIAGVNLGANNGYVADLFFSLLMQIGILFLMPLFIFKFVLKKSTLQVFLFSNIRKTSIKNIIISVALGICFFIVTIAVSTIWQIFLSSLGYRSSTSSDADSVNGWWFFLSIFTVAVLPGFCEEFALRGGFLTTIDSVYNRTSVLIVGGIAFGLFHQFIGQVFFTAVGGVFLVYITLLTKSIWPSVIVHFINNGIGNYLAFAKQNGWLGSGFFDSIKDNIGIAFLILMVCFSIGMLLLLILKKINKNPQSNKRNKLLKNSLMVSFATVNPIVMPSTVLSSSPELDSTSNIKTKFKPDLYDYAFYLGALCVTITSTIFSFIWGL
ncbi:MAG: CPBP family intramembrane metalloprotease [Clostridiales bacterium]|jgi:membrane protease YdiL (CAAX protease family)|nr:CPBP family intramembrane metalloprotease [Clostridiales bacterium]